MRYLIWGAALGLLAGLIVLSSLLFAALMQDAPRGASESKTWFGLFATVWGMPFTLLLDVLGVGRKMNLPAIAIALVANWTALGLLFGFLLSKVRRSRAFRFRNASGAES